MNTGKLDLSDQNITDDTLKKKLESHGEGDNLLAIDLSDNPITDISCLATYKNLNTLNLTRTGVKNISVLANLTHLEALYLSDTQVSDIHCLANLKKLKELFMTSIPITDIRSLRHLTSLEELSLTDTKINKDLSALTGLIHLKKLYLNEIGLDSFSILQLKPLINLELLEIDYEPELQYAKQELFKDIAIGKENALKKIPLKDELEETIFVEKIPDSFTCF